jgi:sulfite reductase (NADPH) flavoprotein alpha-component
VNSPLRVPLTSIVPDSAPFTVEQRQWLDGFFAGLLEGNAAALSPQDAAALLPGAHLDAVGAAGDDGDMPWHDLTLPLAERMKLAEGRPLRRRMMAAMGQQDCGQCGYNCADYADAIFARTEERLNLCVPGGKDTARMLKSLHAEIGAPPAQIKVAEPPVKIAAEVESGHSRDHPAVATFVSRTRLNKPGSEKETWHVELDLAESRLDYAVGDAFGVLPANDPALVDAILRALAAPADFPVGGRILR